MTVRAHSDTVAARRVLLLAAVWAVLVGMAAPWVHPASPWWQVPNTLIGSLLAFAWMRFDADGRGLRRGYLLKMAVAGLPVLGVPVYLFRSRSFGRALLAQALFLLLLIGLLLLVVLSALASLAAGGGL
jgi:hypothetical protein